MRLGSWRFRWPTRFSKHFRHWCRLALSACLGALAMAVLLSRHDHFDTGHNPSAWPAALVPVSLVGVIDDRARFRQIFCALDADHGAQFPDHRPCKDSLQQLSGDGRPISRPLLSRPRDRAAALHVVIIPGMFGQCVKKLALPLQDAAAYMKTQGYRVDTIDVGGRSSSARNAGTIAHALPRLLGPGERLLIIGYSKGMSDILETLAFYPSAIPPGSAVVSLAGIVSGTPLADHPAELDRIISRIPLSQCGPRDNGAVESVSRRHRIAWLADHPLPVDRTYYSIAAFTDDAHISSPLKQTHHELSVIDARNDGQVLYTDAIIPGSHLLGYLNADHWAVALPLARNVPSLRPVLAGRNDFPREIMLEAIVRSVEEHLGRSKGLERH